MSTATIGTRTIAGRHPITGQPIPVTLADDEDVVGVEPDGTPLVARIDGRFGGTFGVTYLCDDVPYDSREAFDPRGEGAF